MQLLKTMKMVHSQLRSQKQKVRIQDTHEPPLFHVGDKVGLCSKRTNKQPFTIVLVMQAKPSWGKTHCQHTRQYMLVGRKGRLTVKEKLKQ